MNVSFEGMGELVVTCKAEAGVTKGAAVRMVDSGVVGACAAGDRFCGVAVSVSEDGYAAVQLGGLVKVAWKGEAPAPGYNAMSADATGGVKVDEAGGEVLVVAVDETEGTAVIRL